MTNLKSPRAEKNKKIQSWLETFKKKNSLEEKMEIIQL